MPYFIIQGPKPLTSGVSYVGPGDVVPNAAVWWGLRGYNAAYCTGGSPALDCVDVSTGLNSSTINITTSGALDYAAITAKGAAQLCTKLYDQTGGGHHLLQASLAAMPELILYAPGLYTLRGINKRMVTAGTVVQAQPFSVSIVAQQLNSTTSGLLEDLDTNGFMYAFGPTTNLVQMFNGTNITAPQTDLITHALQFIAQGSSSVIMVDGATVGALNPGTGGPNGRLAIFERGSASTGDGITYLFEAGMWSGAVDYTSMRLNQQAFWSLP